MADTDTYQFYLVTSRDASGMKHAAIIQARSTTRARAQYHTAFGELRAVVRELAPEKKEKVILHGWQ